MEEEQRIAVDLFSGTGSATEPFRESENWKVIGIDINPERERTTTKWIS